MPADKLDLLCRNITKKYARIAKEQGYPKGGYARFVDLRETDSRLPILLYCGGVHNGINKIEFVGVAGLGMSRVEDLTRKIFGNLERVRVFRIDWCVDILGVSVWDLAECCHIPRVQNFAVYRSRKGDSFYPQRSRQRAVLFYDRLKHLHAKRDPLAQVFRPTDLLTRVEIQLRGNAVVHRRFSDIRRFAETDLLRDLTFWKLRLIPENAKPLQRLAVERIRSLTEELGLQGTAKRFSPSEWAYVKKTFLTQMEGAEVPDVKSLMRKSMRDWLEDRVRFPRAKSE